VTDKNDDADDEKDAEALRQSYGNADSEGGFGASYGGAKPNLGRNGRSPDDGQEVTRGRR
jgi:hypothetical protein